MISKTEAQAILTAKKKLPFSRNDFTSFSRPYSMFGKLLTGCLATSYKRKPKLEVYQSVFGEEVRHNPWATEEGIELANLIFGTVRAPYLSTLWTFMETLPYLQVSTKKPYRSAVNQGHLEHKLNVFFLLAKTAQEGFSDLSFKEQILFCGYTHDTVMGYLFGSMLKEGHQEVEEIIMTVAQGVNPEVNLSKQSIKALLLSGKDNHRQLVESIFIEEELGSPQYKNILYYLYETPKAVFESFVDVILTHGHTADETVRKTVDEWFGFKRGIPTKEMTDELLGFALDYINDSEKRNQVVKGENLVALFIALWSLALTDVALANTKAFDIATDDSISKDIRLVALHFISETGIKIPNFIPYLELNWGNDEALDYWMFKNVPKSKISNKIITGISVTKQKLPKKGLLFENNTFPIPSFEIIPEYYDNFITNETTDAQIEGLVEGFDSMNTKEQIAIVKRIFNPYFRDSMVPKDGYQFFRVHEHVEELVLNDDAWQRKFLHQAITHKNEAVRATALQAMYRLNRNTRDMSVIEKLLGTADTTLRDSLLDIVLKEEDEKVLEVAENLLGSEAIQQRLTGLELLAAMQKAERSLPYIAKRINTHFQTQKITKVDEIVMLDGLLGSNDNESAPYLKMDKRNRNKILALFGRRGIGVFQAALLSLLQQSDEGAGEMLTSLLASKDPKRRLAGLHAATHLVTQDRPKNLVPDALKSYRKRKDMTTQEKVLLSRLS